MLDNIPPPWEEVVAGGAAVLVGAGGGGAVVRAGTEVDDERVCCRGAGREGAERRPVFLGMIGDGLVLFDG